MSEGPIELRCLDCICAGCPIEYSCTEKPCDDSTDMYRCTAVSYMCDIREELIAEQNG